MDVLSALKYLPENINAAKSSPLGFVCLLVSLVFLLALAFFIRERGPVKIGVLIGFCVFGLIALMVGNSRRLEAEETHKREEFAKKQVPPVQSAPKPFGKVIDEQGKPVAYAKVSIEPGGVPPTVITTTEGGYQFDGFAEKPGTPTLTVSRTGFADYSTNLSPESIGVFQRVQLKREKQVPLPLPSGSDMRRKTFTLTGEVFDQKGNPVVRAEVTIDVAGDPPQHLTAYTRSDGAYTIPGVKMPPGATVTIAVHAKEFDVFSRDIKNSDSRVQQIQLSPVDTSGKSSWPPAGTPKMLRPLARVRA